MAGNNIAAKALTNGLDLHWTTIADFISSNGEKFEDIFIKVLAYCVELGLAGGKTLTERRIKKRNGAAKNARKN